MLNANYPPPNPLPGGGGCPIPNSQFPIPNSQFPIPNGILAIRSKDTTIDAELDGQRVSIAANNFPLQFLELEAAPEFGLGSVAGSFSGEAEFDLIESIGFGEIRIAQPKLGYLQGQELNARIDYQPEAISLDGAVKLPKSQYRFNALVSEFSGADANPTLDGKILVEQGEVEDILLLMQWFDIQDPQRGLLAPEYSSAEIVEPQSVGMPEAPIKSRLRRFSELSALLEQLAIVRQTPAVPELLDFRGKFDGEIAFAGDLLSGINLNFDFKGQDIEWRPQRSYYLIRGSEVVREENRIINIDKAIVNGSLDNKGTTTFNPLRLEVGEAVLSFVGAIDREKLSGQVRVENLPAGEIRNFVDIPTVFVDGRFGLSANIAGSIEEPQSRGLVSFEDASINGEKIPNLKGSFSYSKGRLRVNTIEATSLGIFASVPVPPTPYNNRVSLNLNIANEGLSLVNILSNKQVEWVDGTGQAVLVAEGIWNSEQGRIEELMATGQVTVENATVNSLALPEPLTNVTGKAILNSDRITVEVVEGSFSSGVAIARGVLPLSQPLAKKDPDAANPLTVALDGLKVNLKGLYNGSVEGRISINGTALVPKIGGDISLFDGKVLLPDPSQAQLQRPLVEEEILAPQYENLRLRLKDNLRVTSPPVLDFLATGNLRINGFFDDPRAKGRIRLLRGEVNLFSTQFRLDRTQNNSARFTDNLDPFLQVRLITSVPEVTRRSQGCPQAESSLQSSSNVSGLSSGCFAPNSTEISENIDLGLGEVRTVRVEARIDGRSSQLFDVLELTSSPARDEAEIFALIGGGFINTLGRANSPLAIANLAGSTFLSRIQNAIGDTLGLSEFRLAPTLVDPDRSNGIGIEVEAGLDITRNLSVSVFRILLDDSNTRYNLRYRFNDNVLLRGSTDFDGDSRTVLEYEVRF